MSEVRASVLIPAHDHATTLPLTVASVLRQTVPEIEVLVIGDGVTDASRAAVEELVRGDDRVRFLDFSKGPHHGEIYRHEAVLAARSDAILYLCDDDLLLPGHVADLLALLEEADFVQSRNGYVTADGNVRLHATDLGDPDCVRWHLIEPRRNQTSITGSGHSRTYYLEVGERWETTPPGEWPDHYQWKKFFRRPDFRGATSHRMTALQFPSHLDGREDWTPQQRYDELARWAAFVAEPGAQERIDALVDRATQQALARALVDVDRLVFELEDAHSNLRARDTYVHELHLRVAAQAQELHELRELSRVRGVQAERRLRKLKAARAELAAARAALAALQASSSWRLTSPLRKARALTRMRRDQPR
jgi:glycosyltransferase involved in cell wall biosynthesis